MLLDCDHRQAATQMKQLFSLSPTQVLGAGHAGPLICQKLETGEWEGRRRRAPLPQFPCYPAARMLRTKKEIFHAARFFPIVGSENVLLALVADGEVLIG